MAIDLLKLSPDQVDQLIHIQSMIWRQKEASDRVLALRDYYDGIHPVYLSDRQKEFIGKLMSEGEFEFNHNVVRSVVDTLRERLSVSGFTVNGAGLDDDGKDSNPDAPEAQLAALFWSWWEENRYDAQQIRLHRRALRDGLSYVMVSFDNVLKQPSFSLHQVDDGKTGIVVHRDPEDENKILFAVRYFYTYDPMKPGATGKERKTVYFPHEIRKYIRDNANIGGWRTIMDDGDEAWPLPWVDSKGTPLGIPVIEFQNPGGSEIAQIIGLQDALNKSWLDLIASADAEGFPILVKEDADPESYQEATAAEEDAEDEDADGLFFAPGRMLDLKGAKAHRIEGANLQQLINVILLIVETIAGISRTPQYYLRPMGGADVPSGEALKQLESGIVKRALERHLIFGQSWADVLKMAYNVARTFGTALPEVPKLKVQTLWQTAETRQELTDAQRAEILKRLGVPDDVIWEILGFSPQQIAKFKATQRSDQAATIATVAAAIQAAQPTPAPVALRQPAPSVPVANGNGNGVVTP